MKGQITSCGLYRKNYNMKNKYIAMGILATLGIVLAGAGEAKANSKLAEKLHKKFKGIKEYDDRFEEILIAMWIAGGKSEATAKVWGYKYAWSAAFISYVMVKSGFENFPVSVSHTCFASKIKKGNYEEYALRRVSEYAPKVGDIVMLNRNGGGLTYDKFHCGQSSHSDIVYKIKGDYAYTIGGNVSNQIAERRVKLDSEGKIDNKLYFAVIEVK